MQRCLNCTNTSEFFCQCQQTIMPLCYKHASTHFFHEQIHIVPSQSLHIKIQSLNEILNSKKKKITNLIFKAEEITGKCINNIHEAYLEVETKLTQCLNDVENAMNKLKTLQIGKAEKYLTVHSFLFKENADLLNSDMVIFQEKYVYIEHITKKLFKVFSTTEFLSQKTSLSNFDKEFYEKEIKMIKIQQKEKVLRKDNGSKMKKSILKKNCIKNGMLYDFIKSGVDKNYYIETSLLYSEYSRKINKITYRGIKFSNKQFNKIIQYFQNYEKIKNIELKNVISNNKQFSLFCKYLKKINCIKTLYLPTNGLGDNDMSLFSESTKNMKRLSSLIFSQNIISNQGCIHLSKTLPCFSNLKELDLSYNKIGPEGAEALSQALPQLKMLEELFLQHNSIKPEGIMSIMIGVHTLSHICILNFAMNEGYDEGGLAIAEYAWHLKCLTRLYIDIVTSADVKQRICQSVAKSCKVICINENDRVVIKKWELE